VDDDRNNLRVLSGLLRQEGYQIRQAINGHLAIQTAQIKPPNLILLDVMMPELDGYEVCNRLKQDVATCHIPIIFISALDNLTHKSKAFLAGGSDYITKPFQAEEVLMRVKNQLTIYYQQEQLRQQNQQLLQEIHRRQAAEEKYRSIFEHASEGIFQTSLDGGYLSANPALAQIYGYQSPEELIQQVINIQDQLYVQPHRRDEIQAYLQQHQHITEVESEVYRKDGSTIWISENIRVVYSEDGHPRYYEGTVQDISARRRAEQEVRQQRIRAERLLHNILPYKIAQKLQQQEQSIADYFDSVTVLFADLVNFTLASSAMTPDGLVKLLSAIFSEFDQLVDRYQLEKIKTIGDEYMVAAGLPIPREDHVVAIAHLALDMQAAIQKFQGWQGDPFQLRIGIHTGPVVAGVIGTKKFAYDLWGDTVNVASRMESTGEANRIQVTTETYHQLQHEFYLSERGVISVKGKGDLRTYWLEGRRFIG
jgi:PAS domain S-box-containing protein